MIRGISSRAQALTLALALSATPVLFAWPVLAAPPAPAGAPASPAPAAAAPGAALLPGGGSREPINVSANKLDYFDKEQKAVYTGNVVAVQGETRLNASVLTIYFDRKPTAGASGTAPAAKEGPGGANSGLRRMEGKGPISITNKDQIGTGDALVYDKPQNKFMLIGNVALSQGENVTRGDQLTYDLSTGQAIVTSKGRVHTLIVPGEDAKPGATPAPKPAAPKPAAPKPAAPPALRNTTP
ncbi:LptA/OstA family protein [Rhodoblastus sp.]|jgi:lipopolysaccharide export system protein LptA|uniref:LptA/OstA family protein n=1 Tax=Rhodoblastus sp. TaxID=1962975 RepID=UPI0025D1305E|nr:LptA/OstA family protein [Rhodoblastus sp.]